MSVSGETISEFYDNEQINEVEETELYDFENYYCPEEGEGDERILYPKWKNTPRAPSDFKTSGTSTSSCRDSDYERWLEEYYNDLVLQNLPSAEDFMGSTTDLVAEKRSKEFSTPIFRSRVWDTFAECSSEKYWGPKEVRRHWPLRKRQGEYLFYPAIYPDLNLRSRYGRFHSLLYAAAAVPEIEHKAGICHIFKKVLESLLVQNTKVAKVLNCDNLYNLKWFDFMTKKAVMRCLCKFLRTQNYVEKVYFENACLKRLEAIIVLCALSRSGGYSIKELHIWKMFDYGECPLLLNKLQKKKNSSRQNQSIEFFTKVHYLQILYKFSSLTHLSVNYAYLANPEGDALLCVKSLRTGCLRELRILCLKEERPLVTDPSYGVGGYLITDGVWKRASEWCPHLQVKFVFLNMPQYENIILFLSKSIPVTSIYISSGINFEFETPWEIDCTLLELRNWYSNTLGERAVESLSFHLWHHRDLLDFVIKCKILDEFPNLLNFEFIGVLENVETLDQFCCQLCRGTYKLKTLLFWVEEEHTDKKKLEGTREKVALIRSRYKRKFQVANIDADIQTYRM